MLEVNCHYGNKWIPMGRARSRCPHCGAEVGNNAHPLRNLNALKIHIASKTKHAAKWRKLRDKGHNIISTWIDEAGPGESKCLSDLAVRCVTEAAQADRLILFAEAEDILKGALIEVGAALAHGVPIFAVGYSPSFESALRNHPLWKECLSVEEALR